MERGGGGGAEAAGGAAAERPPAAFRLLTRLDAVANRVYTSRANPLYHSGAVTVALLLVLLVTGLYLLLFYRLGAPHASVVRIDGQAWTGRWIRSLHRFASDAAVVAAAVHAFRMYAQRRVWGPRALAWVSGLVLLGAILVSGWTGFVLVWDTHAQVLAIEGARLLDVLPLFGEPVARSFVGESGLPAGFFFLNLFVHIALPTGMCVLLWVHVARVSRPVLLPARAVLVGVVGGLTLLSVAWPLAPGPEADLLRVAADVPFDWFFGFWLPVTQRLPAAAVWGFGSVAALVVCAVPWLVRGADRTAAAAVVDTRSCTGCEQCVRDCPYDAITMIERTDRAGQVALVNAALCTSCGICAGSCPPMSIGVPGGGGRDQVAQVRAFLEARRPGVRDVVVVGCTWSGARGEAERTGALFLGLPCVGTMHSSTVELLLRGGAGGVLVAGCPEHDGRTREGMTWTEERLFAGRAAELKARVDRRRVRLVDAALGDAARFHAAAESFAAEIEALAAQEAAAVDIVAVCREYERRRDAQPVEVP